MIVSIGEALVDLIQRRDGLYEARPGGAPANTAITIARLGLPVQFAGRTSSSGFGPTIRERLESNGVGLELLVDAPEPATLAIASLTSSGSATYSFYLEGTVDWQWSEAELDRVAESRPSALHFGSLGAAIAPGAEKLEELVSSLYASGTTIVSYDLNIRPGLGLDVIDEKVRVERQVASAHIVKASDDDLHWLYPERPADEVCSEWARGGRFVIVTRGREGARLTTPELRRIDVPSAHVDVVDTIGAGDAFCGGLLVALNTKGALGSGAFGLGQLGLSGWAEAIAFAARVAAFTCTRRGAEPPTLTELESFHTSRPASPS